MRHNVLNNSMMMEMYMCGMCMMPRAQKRSLCFISV